MRTVYSSLLVAGSLLAAAGIRPLVFTSHGTAPSRVSATTADDDDDEEDDEDEIEVDELPAAVQALCKVRFGQLAGLDASVEEDHHVAVYEVNGKDERGVELSIKCLTSGQLVEVEHETTLDRLPAEVRASLGAAQPGATLLSAEEIAVHAFEVEFQQGGKTFEAVVSPTGLIQRSSAEHGKRMGGDDEDDEDEEDDD